MRIISGKYKSRRIDPPSNITARPTTDFAKESLFNVLGNRIDWEETTALDLFGGTGGISFELASRGCPSVICVEKSRLHADFIRKTCTQLGADNLRVLQADVFTFLASCKIQFDLIFADPPYEMPQLNTLPDVIFGKNILTEEGLFILEHPRKLDFSAHSHFAEHRSYGNVNFSLFEN